MISDKKNQKKRNDTIKELSIVEENKDEIDPQYEMLYLKIDLYLEKISKLDETTKYKLLDELFQKFGRDANIYNKENKDNIYCKYGNKVIGCSHSRYMIELYKNKNNSSEIIESLLDKYGIENDGQHWCRNCGQEIYISDFETIEGFKKTGARDITHEVIESDEYESKYTDNELVATLKLHLEKSENMDISKMTLIL